MLWILLTGNFYFLSSKFFFQFSLVFWSLILLNWLILALSIFLLMFILTYCYFFIVFLFNFQCALDSRNPKWNVPVLYQGKWSELIHLYFFISCFPFNLIMETKGIMMSWFYIVCFNWLLFNLKTNSSLKKDKRKELMWKILCKQFEI